MTALGLDSFFDTRDLDPSTDFTSQLERSVRSASRMLVCVTPDVARDDSFVKREIGYALGVDQRRRRETPERRLPITPIVFSGGVLPISIANLTMLELSNRPSVEELTALLREHFAQKEEPTLAERKPNALEQYLHDFLGKIVDQLEASVDEVIEPTVSFRAELARDANTLLIDAPRVSPAYAPIHRTVRTIRAAETGGPEKFATVRHAFEHFGGTEALLDALDLERCHALIL